jgi:hypothetical protein
MKQRQIPLLTEAQQKHLEKTDEKLVKQCADGAMALRMTINHTSLSQEDLAIAAKTNKKSIQRAMKGSCGLAVDTLIRLCGESNSVFLAQYICRQLGGKFVFLTEDEKKLEVAEDYINEIKNRMTA